jgi:hypothetical protein
MTLNGREIISGLTVLVIGIGACFLSLRISSSGPWIQGPMSFPLIISILLSLSGLGILARSFFVAAVDIPALPLRPLLVVVAGCVLFSVLIVPLGLVPSVALLVLISSFADDRPRIVESLVLAAIMALVCYLMFTVALSLPMRPFGAWLPF